MIRKVNQHKDLMIRKVYYPKDYTEYKFMSVGLAHRAIYHEQIFETIPDDISQDNSIQSNKSNRVKIEINQNIKIKSGNASVDSFEQWHQLQTEESEDFDDFLSQLNLLEERRFKSYGSIDQKSTQYDYNLDNYQHSPTLETPKKEYYRQSKRRGRSKVFSSILPKQQITQLAARDVLDQLTFKSSKSLEQNVFVNMDKYPKRKTLDSANLGNVQVKDRNKHYKSTKYLSEQPILNKLDILDQQIFNSSQSIDPKSECKKQNIQKQQKYKSSFKNSNIQDYKSPVYSSQKSQQNYQILDNLDILKEQIYQSTESLPLDLQQNKVKHANRYQRVNKNQTNQNYRSAFYQTQLPQITKNKNQEGILDLIEILDEQVFQSKFSFIKDMKQKEPQQFTKYKRNINRNQNNQNFKSANYISQEPVKEIIVLDNRDILNEYQFYSNHSINQQSFIFNHPPREQSTFKQNQVIKHKDQTLKFQSQNTITQKQQEISLENSMGNNSSFDEF